MVYCRTVGIATLSVTIVKLELIAASRYFNATDISWLLFFFKGIYLRFTRWVKVTELLPTVYFLPVIWDQEREDGQGSFLATSSCRRLLFKAEWQRTKTIHRWGGWGRRAISESSSNIGKETGLCNSGFCFWIDSCTVKHRKASQSGTSISQAPASSLLHH